MVGQSDPAGTTPITWEEQQGLIATWVSTRAELNTVEQENIATAVRWSRSRRFAPRTVANEAWLQRLHRRMFSTVWKWAGQYRTSPRNLGVPHWEISAGVRTVAADILAMVEAVGPDDDGTIRDDIAVVFHHRLVSVHPFPNGNGRHSRLASDVLARALGRPIFVWGSAGGATLGEQGALRRAYIDALHAADNYDLAPLAAFARGRAGDANT